MSRDVNIHSVGNVLKVTADNETGDPNAKDNHVYRIINPKDGTVLSVLKFQNGSIKDGAGVNGIRNEEVIAVLIDRLEVFQQTEFKCPENAEAINYLRSALSSLESRTKKRLARGVEGTHKV